MAACREFSEVPINTLVFLSIKGTKIMGQKIEKFFIFFFTENMVFLKFPFRIIKIFELHCKINGENANKCFDHMK